MRGGITRSGPSRRSQSASFWRHAWDSADDRRRASNRTMSVGHDWAFERELLRPLPTEPFDIALTLTPRVDRYARLTGLSGVLRCIPFTPRGVIDHSPGAVERVRLLQQYWTP